MGVAPISPLRAAMAVHVVGHDLVASGEGVPGFGGSAFIFDERPAHSALRAANEKFLINPVILNGDV